jgi:outer membrane lipoprotein-sorting protein
MSGACNFAEKTSPDKVFEKVIAKYKSMKTYKDEGTIIADIESGSMKMTTETSFSILLKKPNLYLISWTQKNMLMPGIVQSGKVWSDGTQPYLYMGMLNAYSKMDSDQIALGSATGISGGAAFTIPSLFLSVFKEQPAQFSRLKDPKIEKIEKIGEDKCYVISGSSDISKKETFWISKKSYLIRKYSRSLEPPEGGHKMQEFTDKQIEEAIKGMGLEVTEENKKNVREKMEKSSEMLKTIQVKGSSTEVHVDISSPEWNKNDFKVDLPEDTVLKKSLFGGLFSGLKEEK